MKRIILKNTIKPFAEVTTDPRDWCECSNPSHRIIKASISICDSSDKWVDLKNIETRFYCYDCHRLINIELS